MIKTRGIDEDEHLFQSDRFINRRINGQRTGGNYEGRNRGAERNC